jgi:hypothetical protein
MPRWNKKVNEPEEMKNVEPSDEPQVIALVCVSETRIGGVHYFPGDEVRVDDATPYLHSGAFAVPK